MTDSSANSRSYGERPLHDDDPLMELSRIVDFGTPVGNNQAWNARETHNVHDADEGQHGQSGFDSLALDLENELLGNFDYSEPAAQERQYDVDPLDAPHEEYHRAAEPLIHDDELFSALGEELELNHEAPVAAPSVPAFEDMGSSEPVSRFDYTQYSSSSDSYSPQPAAGDETSYRENYEADEVSYTASAAYDRMIETPPSRPEAVRPTLSLEDELENLLFNNEPSDNDTQSALNEYADPDADVSRDDYNPVKVPENASFGRGDYAPFSNQQVSFQQENEPAFDEQILDNFNLDDLTFDEQQEQITADSAYEEPVARLETTENSYYERGNFMPGIAGQMPSALASSLASTGMQSESGLEGEDFSFDEAFALDSDELTSAGTVDGTEEDVAGLSDIGLNEDDFFNESDLNLRDGNVSDDAPGTYTHAVLADEDYRSSSAFSQFSAPRVASTPAPEVETLSVAENKVEQTFSLDLPEVNYDNEEDAATGLDDLEAEFAEVFNTVGLDDSQASSSAQSEADKAFEDIFRENVSGYYQAESKPESASLGSSAAGAAMGLGAAVAASATAAGAYVRSQLSARGQTRNNAVEATGSEDNFYNHWAASGAQNVEDGQLGARAVMQPEDELGEAAAAYRDRPVRGRRGLILASAAGVLVLIGGIGYQLIGGSSDEPVVIQADNQPIKQQPENPGGATVPNQDKAVYDRVAGTLPNNPEQKALISSGEEPVDISTANFENNGTQQAADADDNAPLVQPREVETMIVRSDGSIVPSQSSQPQAASPQQQAASNDTLPSVPAGNDEIGAIAAADAGQASVASQPAAAEPATRTPAPAPRAPVIPSRPADQPVNVVGSVAQRTQNQAAAPQQTASAAGAGGYFIQIASQPSAELAQKSYANMAQRYGSVIGGRSVDIKRADITGKGTYYRVRVQAGSREEASALCGRLKSAGGDCLVTR
ncbi:SPOR domain-containing protein [Brucella sp. BE17]|uniref:SPOR domain-containing protein n=1 Tax=Brucella sp. BE17 TaxID=3142977 RepID=UPI0031BA1626